MLGAALPRSGVSFVAAGLQSCCGAACAHLFTFLSAPQKTATEDLLNTDASAGSTSLEMRPLYELYHRTDRLGVDTIHCLQNKSRRFLAIVTK